MSRITDYVQGFRGFERDARVFLFATLFSGAAIGLFWIDFNLFLAATGLDRATIGLVATSGSLVAALSALPASALSDRFGRRRVMLGALLLMAAALAGLAVSSGLLAIFLLGAAYASGQQAFLVVQVPFLTEHSTAERRSELFALQFAAFQLTQLVAALLGGFLATALAGVIGIDGAGPGAFRILLVLQALLAVAAMLIVRRLRSDRPTHLPHGAIVERRPRISDRRRFAKILIPGFLVSVGAGQIIPFLNLFVSGKFGLDLAALNGVFAVTGLGTMLAILLQPALASRFGRIRSVVLVQVASLPFLVVLGFSPLLWTVIAALAVRNSLMNAGNPILNAFAMDQVPARERATLAGAMSVIWALGWVIAGPWYSLIQATFGFSVGYSIAFITVIVLYGVATTLYWHWFRDAEPLSAADPSGGAAPEGLAARVEDTLARRTRATYGHPDQTAGPERVQGVVSNGRVGVRGGAPRGVAQDE